MINSSLRSRPHLEVLIASIIGLIAGVATILNIDLLIKIDIAILGYLLVIIILILFWKYPYYALLFSFFTKPIIDMFWETKDKGIISPLYIAGIVVPLMAIFRRKSITGRSVKSSHDKVIIAYLFLFGTITLLKILLSPHYLINSLDTYARIFSVTSFYFIGKYYFQQEKQKRQLIWVIVLSTVIPFSMTFFRGDIWN